VLDLDASDNPTHGRRKFSVFHGFYDQHSYRSLLCYDGTTSDLISLMLRTGKAHTAAGVCRLLQPIVRAGAVFCVPGLYSILRAAPLRLHNLADSQ
jgi:hypothetical protein